jgi:hypothetical protein
MSRTDHHSERWGHQHRFADRSDRGYGFSRRGVGEAPGWHVRLYDSRPGRMEDRALLRRILAGLVDADAAVFRLGGRRPHTWWW